MLHKLLRYDSGARRGVMGVGPRDAGGGSRPLRVAVALITVVAASVSCGGSPGTSGPGRSAKAGGQLVWGKQADTDQLDPATAGTGFAWEIFQLTYERLVTLDEGLKPVPELAESWEQTSPTTYVFTLRKGVKFSNGREMTADDVVGSMNRLRDPKLAASWVSQLPVRSVEATGDDQVTFTLSAPRTSFVPALAGSAAAILPMRELKAGTFDPKKELLGTGPFAVATHVQNESWTFVRNPHYWRPGIPKVEKLTARIMPEESARAAALRDGSIDVTTFETPDSTRLLKAQANVKTVVQATTDFYRLDVNAKSSILRDERLRQAVSLSIDRTKIRDVALGGVGRPTAAVPVPFGVCDPTAMPFAAADVQKARELVEAAGGTGKTLEILTAPLIPMSSAMAQVLQQNLQAAGFTVRIVPVEVGQLIKRAYGGKKAEFDLVVSWSAGFADPAMVLSWWNPANAPFSGGYLNTDPELNKLIDAGFSTPAGPERTQKLRDSCARIAQNANVIPLLSKDAIVAYRSDKVSAAIPPVEGYAVPLRRIAEFATR
jgi:peptide/nickel transport system substrate-binding protein